MRKNKIESLIYNFNIRDILARQGKLNCLSCTEPTSTW